MRYTSPVPKALAAAALAIGFVWSSVILRPATSRANAPAAADSTPLFDGKSLDGWEGHTKYWSVVDGVIVGKNEGEIPVSTYLLTKKKYGDFRLTAKVKLAKSEMHSGISFWGRVAPEKGDEYTYMGHLVMFPTNWGMYDLYRRGGLPVDGKPAKKVGNQHDWNDLEILATGHRVRVAVNGVAVVDFTDPKPDSISEGPIGLQLHSNKEAQEVQFKELTVEAAPKQDKLLSVK